MTGINIDILADTRQFQSQVDDVSDQLSQVAKNLDSVTAAGDKTGGTIESSMRTAQESAAQTGNAFRTLTSTVKSETDKQTDDVTVSTEEVNRIQREAIKTSGSVIAQSVAQSVQGFDGTAEGAISAITNIGSNLAAFSTGPVAAIATAGVLAFGLIQGAITNADNQSKNFQTDVTNLTDDFEKTGSAGQTSLGYIVDQLKKISDGTSTSGLNLEQIKAQAKSLGVPFKELAETYAGGTTHLESQIAAAKALAAVQELAANKEEENAGRGAENAEAAHGAAVQRYADTESYLGQLESEKQKLQDAVTNEKLAAQAGLPDYQRKLNLLTQLDGAYDDAAGDVTDYLNSETGLLNTSAYITAMQARAKALDDYKKDLATSGLTGAAKDFLEAQGESAAASLLQGYKTATPAQQAALNQIWTTAGESSAGSFTGSFAKATSGSKAPTVTPVIAQPNVSDFLSSLQKQLNKNPLTVPVKSSSTFGRSTP